MFTEREPPEHIMEQLREIDSRAELIWVGTGWLLACKADNPHAKAEAHAAAHNIVKNGKTLQTEQRFLWYMFLATEGIRPISLYEQEEADERIVKDFQERDFNWRNRAEQTVAENIEQTADDGLEGRKQQMRDAVDALKGDMFRKLQGNTMVGSAGKAKD